MYVCMRMRMRMRMCMRMCIYACVRACVRTCTYVCVAVPLSPLIKREKLKTQYIQIWCRCVTNRGRDVFSSISVKCLYPLHMYA